MEYFKIAGEFERAGQLDKALTALLAAERDPLRASMGNLIRPNISRLIDKANRQAQAIDGLPDPLFEHANNPNTYSEDTANAIPIPIVSLTSISTRIERVPRTIETLLKQSHPAQSINVYVSEEPYLIDKGIPRSHSALREISQLGANVYFVRNFGPYRKQYPLIFQLRRARKSESTPIVTVDDDVLYPADILERLMTRLAEQNAVVAHRGRMISLNESRIAPYNTFETPSSSAELRNMGTGKNGIAYRLSHFPTNIAEYVGHILAPTADDIWCKWVTTRYCIPTRILEPRAAFDPSLDFAESAPQDKAGLYHTYNARGTNDDALHNLEAYFGSRGDSITSILVRK